MACSRPTVLRTKPVACATLVTAALLASVALNAQDANRYILATRRSGAIEIIDPESLTGLAAASGNLFLYEMFGWKLDRRTNCFGVQGGAWIVEPSSGRLLAHVAPDLHFSELIADREKGELYGISAGDPNWRSGIELVRMDAQDGRILQSRTLEDDYWRIAFAPLRTVHAADVRAVTSAKK
jgi:hypothetical protein